MIFLEGCGIQCDIQTETFQLLLSKRVVTFLATSLNMMWRRVCELDETINSLLMGKQSR